MSEVGGDWKTPSAQNAGAVVGQKEDFVAWYRPASGAARDVYAQVNVSSSRISCLIETFFRPDTSGAETTITDYAAAWKVWGLAWDTANKMQRLHQVDNSDGSSRDMPTAYEMSSQIRAYRIQGEFDGLPQTVAPADVPGVWFLRARWEINTPMDDKLARLLLAQCSLSVGQSVNNP